jgi:ferrochelatase
MAVTKPADHPRFSGPRVGVLLLNLGTPDGTDYWPVRRYLSEFLSDTRVIETSPLIWQPILQGIVLSTRPQKSGANYARIWDKAENDSPFRVITQRQTAKLQQRLGDGVLVDYAMRYGNPSTASRLEAMQKAGCQKILLAPLYPQYSATTTATANDKAFDALKTMRWQPAIRTLPAYFDTPVYVAALA